jgi:hypothetical protein
MSLFRQDCHSVTKDLRYHMMKLMKEANKIISAFRFCRLKGSDP